MRSSLGCLCISPPRQIWCDTLVNSNSSAYRRCSQASAPARRFAPFNPLSATLCRTGCSCGDLSVLDTLGDREKSPWFAEEYRFLESRSKGSRSANALTLPPCFHGVIGRNEHAPASGHRPLPHFYRDTL